MRLTAAEYEQAEELQTDPVPTWRLFSLVLLSMVVGAAVALMASGYWS